MFDVDESVVELEECVGSGVGNAWSFSVCGVVTVFDVDESMVELEECTGGVVALTLWEMFSLPVCVEVEF